MTAETFTAILPAHWASYLINGDASSFDLYDDGGAEVARIDAWIEENRAQCVDVGESEFRWRSMDCPGELAGDYSEFTFYTF